MVSVIQKHVSAVSSREAALRHHIPIVAACLLGTVWPSAIVPVALETARAIPAQVASAGSNRARLLDLHTAASKHLEEADQGGRTSAEAAGALQGLAAALAAFDETPASSETLSSQAPAIPDEVRTELRRAAAALSVIARDALGESRVDDIAQVRAAERVDSASLRLLLERLRTAIDGEIALGLSFQGSFSQTRPSEPAVGGHASAMGPAPAAPISAETNAAPSPVTFEEPVQLPTRTWAGGPTKDHILESAGNGLALFDYDNDGLLDIYLVTAAQLTPARERVPHRNALYRNLGGWRFEDVSAKTGVDGAAWGSGACVGDVDGDGWLDLYVTNWGANALYRNRGDGTFEEITAQAGVAGEGWSTGCTFFDADGDGDLDLYVTRYVRTTWDEVVQAQRTLSWRNGPSIMAGPAGLPAESDLFFENVGNARFREVSRERGLGEPARAYGFAVVATDFDDDGHVDLFVANDSNPNFLYRNRGDGHFESVGLLAGVGVNEEARAQAGMGADAGDAHGDGRMDLVLTAFAHDRNTLYRNLDGGLFEDATIAARLAAPTFARMGWGVAFLDADLDGRQDLVIANGHIFPDVDDHPHLDERFRQKNQLLLNTGGQFRDVSMTAGAGLQVEKASRGLAVGDIDNDGDPDLVVSNVDDTPTVLENRQQTGHHWVGVRVASPSGNRFAIGAKVTVAADGGTQVREIRSGGSYLSQGDLRVLFGLGRDEGLVTIEVRMPGGARWRWKDVPVDRYHGLVLTPETRVTDAEGEK